MDSDKIMNTILYPESFTISSCRHFHVRCNNSREQQEFFEKLANRCTSEDLPIRVEDVCCLYIESPKDLLRLLIKGLGERSTQISTTQAFLLKFRSLVDPLEKKLLNKERIIFCLRRAECLQEIETFPLLAQAFSGFDDWFRKMVTFVTLSTLPWSLLLNSSSSVSPSCVQFSLPSSTELLIDQVMKYAEVEIDKSVRFSKSFASSCIKYLETHNADPRAVFLLVCKIAHICKDKINPTKANGDTNLIREVVAQMSDNELYFLLADFDTNHTTDDVDAIPYYAKFVLLASFLASYNQKKTDLRFFSKEREGTRRTEKEKLENKFLETGPQVFPFSRMLGILCFLYNDHLKMEDIENPDINYLVNMLCEMRLLTRISGNTNIQKPKFRCDASLEFVIRVARSLEIDLNLYIEGDPSSLASRMQLVRL